MLGHWAAVCLRCGAARRWFDEFESEVPAVCPECGGEMLRRIVVLIFGIIQIFVGLRIVLLLLNAREGNGIVSFILDVSQLFVAPFIGIFNSDSLHASGSVLDIAAIAAAPLVRGAPDAFERLASGAADEIKVLIDQ